MAALSTQSKTATLEERGDDLYETPEVAVKALMAVETLPLDIWEPACGPGSIVRVLRASGHNVLATDLRDYRASGHQDRALVDFLLAPRMATTFGGKPYGGIITNPPYRLAHQFVVRALDLTDYVCMLLRLAFLESERRRDILDNGPLARIHVFRDRLPMMHRDGWEGPRSSSAMAFAWFVWDRRHKGPPTLHRVSWKEFA